MSESNGTRPCVDNSRVMESIVTRSDLSDLEIRVALLILSFRDPHTLRCTVTERTLALMTGKKRNQIHYAIKKLKEDNTIQSYARYNPAKKKRGACFYFFMEDIHQALAMNPPLGIDAETLKNLGDTLENIGMNHLLNFTKQQLALQANPETF